MSSLLVLNDLINKITGINDVKYIFITGRSGAGKTTVSESLKNEYNFIHFDGDQFPYGNNPIKQSGQVITGQHKENMTNNMKQIYNELMVKKGYFALFEGNKPDISVWKPFYTLFSNEIIKQRKIYPNKNMVISHAVYLREVRDLLRELLGNNLIFIILNTSTDLLLKRKLIYIEETAQRIGKTGKEYLKSLGSSFEKATKTITMAYNGFETIQYNEMNTYQIDINQFMDVKCVCKHILHLICK